MTSAPTGVLHTAYSSTSTGREHVAYLPNSETRLGAWLFKSRNPTPHNPYLNLLFRTLYHDTPHPTPAETTVIHKIRSLERFFSCAGAACDWCLSTFGKKQGFGGVWFADERLQVCE